MHTLAPVRVKFPERLDRAGGDRSRERSEMNHDRPPAQLAQTQTSLTIGAQQLEIGSQRAGFDALFGDSSFGVLHEVRGAKVIEVVIVETYSLFEVDEFLRDHWN